MIKKTDMINKLFDSTIQGIMDRRKKDLAMEKHIHIAIPGGHVTWTGEEPPTPEFMEAINNLVEKAKEKVRSKEPNRFDISEENKESLAEYLKKYPLKPKDCFNPPAWMGKPKFKK